MNVHSLSNLPLNSALDVGHRALDVGLVSRQANLVDKRKIVRQFPPKGRYLIAVSGGRDSVALLHQLVGLGYKNLVICHLDHQLRGRSSAVDSRFVQKLAQKCDVDFALGSADVRALAARKKTSIETTARDARYTFFAKVARQKRCGTIFLAHHADDLVETFLMNLFRGAGTSGLAAMRETAVRRIDGIELTLARPLLGTWRDQIDKYVRAHRLRFREDASNKNLTPLRNRVRHRVIPSLEETFGRNLRKNIWRTATIASEEEDFFETLLPDKLLGPVALAVTPLREMSIAVQRRVLRKWLRSGAVADIGFDLIERVRALIDPNSTSAKINLPKDRHVRRRAKKIFIEG